MGYLGGSLFGGAQKWATTPRLKGGLRAFTLIGTSTGPEENLLRYRAYRGCYSPHGCGEAGKRLGSLCAIEVEGLKP